ncbi:MAG: hypothetical protein HY791_10260 [Deltaproteobacteria bacterium]|nr:hypothetical protein [Deltaproteobacteria bacterium]
MSDNWITLAILIVVALGGLYLWRERPWESPCEKAERRCHEVELSRIESASPVCVRRSLDKLKRETNEADCRGWNAELDGLGAPK